MRRSICKIRVAFFGYSRGHRWQPVYENRRAESVAMVCLRCRENGWLIREY